MLLDEDRIIREIRRIAELVGKALQLESLSGHEEAEEALGVLHRGLFGLDRDLTLRLSPDSLAMLLAPGQRDAAITLLENEVRYLEGRGEHDAANVRKNQLQAIR